MTRLDEIPTAYEPPVGARASDVVARIRAIRPSRRAVLRGLVVGAAAATLVPIDWYLARRQASAAADDRSEHMTCTPQSYTEEASNWPAGGPAVCYGGWKRGTHPCSNGYHREGSFELGDSSFTSTRLTTSCAGKNAWRWQGYRCSDATTTATFPDGSEYNGVTIAACALPEGEDAGGGSPSGDGGGSSDRGSSDAGSGDGGSGEDGSGDGSGDRDRDPARPREQVGG